MKKYGDDADQFHNQGTRVEESKKWHEQYQLRHYCSYHNNLICKSHTSPIWKKCPECGKIYNKYIDSSCPHCKESKPKSTYKPKTSGKYTYKPDYSKTYYKPESTNESKTSRKHTYKPDYSKTYYEPKSTYKPKYNNPNLIICSECGRQYNKLSHEDCPYCKKLKSLEFKPKFKICSNCGRRFSINNKFCTDCYTKCSKCGKIYSNELDYCPNCYTKCFKCGKVFSKKLSSCPHCNIECSKCGKIYNNVDYEICPHCNDKHEKLIALALFLAFILFTIIMMHLF